MRTKKPTKAEEILTPFIKGDVRDYSKKDRKHFVISLDIAIKAIQKALRVAKHKKVYILKADSDGTLRSTDQPIGFAVTSEKVAKRYVSEGDVGYTRSYEECVIVDKYPIKKKSK